jgi:hypothetical protein
MAVESNVYGLWVAKQPAKGTPATVATKRVRARGGLPRIARADGEEVFSDLTRFGDAADFVDTLIGQGEPVIQAQTNIAAYLCWLFFGAETFTAKVVSTSAPKFVFEPGATTGFWSTWWTRVGITDIVRRKFNDCKITALRIEASTANKVAKLQPTIISLDPAEHTTSDQSAVAHETQDPMLWTEASGKIKIDGTVYTGQSQCAVVFDDGQAPHYADSARPYDLIAGNAGVRVEAATLLLDAASQARYLNHYYGTTSPAAGAKPVTTLPNAGSYEIEMSRGSTDARQSIKIEIPVVRWTMDDPVDGNPEGGPIEMTFAGGMRNNASGGAPPTAPVKARITIETGSGDNTAHTV